MYVTLHNCRQTVLQDNHIGQVYDMLPFMAVSHAGDLLKLYVKCRNSEAESLTITKCLIYDAVIFVKCCMRGSAYEDNGADLSSMPSLYGKNKEKICLK